MKAFKVHQRITDKDEPSLQAYIASIASSKPLSPEEEVKLMVSYRNGDPSAKEKLITANLRFVVSVAKRYIKKGLPLADLINEGNIGLIKAIDSFDETKGFKLISYAVWWIRQSILEALGDSGRTIRLPSNKILLYTKLENCRNVLFSKLGHEPQPDQLLEELNKDKKKLKKYTEEEVLNALFNNINIVSLDTPIDDDEGSSYSDMQRSTEEDPDKQLFHDESLSIDLQNIFKNLPKDEVYILRASFGIGMEVVPVEKIADILGCCKERIRQRKVTIINKLKKPKYVKILAAYIGD